MVLPLMQPVLVDFFARGLYNPGYMNQCATRVSLDRVAWDLRRQTMRGFAGTVAAMTAVVLFPSIVLAQASIAGNVRDTSQAVLPGVTVEASSPALIEKVRSVVADGTGQYRIVDLRPGTYTVTFTLPGFSTVKREGIELTGTFVATVNAELRVGALEETITVLGETPLVDVQSAKTQTVISDEVLSAIPTSRNYQNLHMLTPGVSVTAGNQDVGGAGGDNQISFSAYGGNFRDSRTQVNGLMVGDPQVGGGRSMYVPHAGSSEEVSITTSGGLGEAETAGVVVNIVYKDGGNNHRGTLFGAGATEGMIGSNYTQALRDAGLRAPNKSKNIFDWEGTYGGPVFEDKLWFLLNARWHGASNYEPIWVNRSAGDPTKWTYDPDFDQQVIKDQFWRSASLRLTWQATSVNKFSVFYEDQFRCVGCKNNGTATSTPEASGRAPSHPNRVGQLIWTSPLTNRVLLEAGGGIRGLRYGQNPFPGHFNPELIRVQEQGGLIPGLNYRAPGTQIFKNWLASYPSRASITYTPGAHSMKLGYNGTFYIQQSAASSMGETGLSYRFRDGVPNQLTQNIHPFDYWTHANQWGLYAQDQWTVKRLTLGGGVRYDRFTTDYPEARIHGRFLPVPFVFPETKGFRLHDITPRLSAAYDLFGDGKTALKMNLGKYVMAQDSNGAPFGPASGAPANRLARSADRSWADANRNYIPDCDLFNLAANGECGAASDQNFGRPVVSTVYDPDLNGWGVRPDNKTFDVTLQRQLLPRMGASVSYHRRWFGNFIVTDNRATTASDYTLFDLPVPNDPRLPVSGVVTGFSNVNPDKFGQVDNYVTRAKNFGNQTEQWNGMDFTMNARLQDVTMQGGLSTGRASRNDCEVRAKVPELPVTPNPLQTGPPPGAAPLAYCDLTEAFQTQIKFLGAYTIPRIGVQVAATLQNIPGQDIQAVWAAPNAAVAPLLRRDLSGRATNITLNVLPPNTYFSDRTTQLDMRFAKILRFYGTRSQISLDLFNALNANTVQTYNSNYLPTGAWRTPNGVLAPRVVKVSGQIDF